MSTTTLRYVAPGELDRCVAAAPDAWAATALFADLCRINTLYMIMRAGSGHIGSSFSSLDIVSWLYRDEIGATPPGDPDRPVYFSSKGHDAPGLYAVLAACGLIDFELVHTLRRLGGLPGHPDVRTPAIEANTGSLGMGISKAKGMCEAARLSADGRRLPVFVLTGDGELQEGQIWESLQGAANRGLGEITVIVDHNRIQSDTWVTDVSDLGDLEAKFAAFGWAVRRCDGHDLHALAAALADLRADTGTPGVIVADTVKGKGVSFMEGIDDPDGLYRFHSGAPDRLVYEKAVEELASRCDERLCSLGADLLTLVDVDVPARTAPTGQRLVAAYSAALCSQMERNDRIVVLDADLVLDTGLIPASKQFPERFIECGIAEQDMVSQAGGLALKGFLPVVHSFACFLAARPTEQMYVNATEGTKIVYVASLAGAIPGGPGHSHQAVRDISLVGAIPGLLAVEPSCEQEVGLLLDCCLNRIPESVYFRLVTPPVEVPYALPAGYMPTPGTGFVLRPGADVTVFGYGPVLLSEAWAAAGRLAAGHGIDVRLVALPWLNHIDRGWLADVTAGTNLVVTLDNHYVRGGQGDTILAALSSLGRGTKSLQRGLDAVPVCGSNPEVLAHHGLDADSIVRDLVAFAAP